MQTAFRAIVHGEYGAAEDILRLAECQVKSDGGNMAITSIGRSAKVKLGGIRRLILHVGADRPISPVPTSHLTESPQIRTHSRLRQKRRKRPCGMAQKFCGIADALSQCAATRERIFVSRFVSAEQAILTLWRGLARSIASIEIIPTGNVSSNRKAFL